VPAGAVRAWLKATTMTESNPAYREFLLAQGFVEPIEWQFEHPEFDCAVIIDGGWLLESLSNVAGRPIAQDDEFETLVGFWQEFVENPPWPRRRRQ
jgi:hypothetical protein